MVIHTTPDTYYKNTLQQHTSPKKKKQPKVKKSTGVYGPSKVSFFICTAISLIVVSLFFVWWFQPSHIPNNFLGGGSTVDVILFLLVSFIIWHPLVMDVLTWAIASHITDIRHHKPVPGLKVAFITTIVPGSESLDLLHKCLPAMMNASYPHDTWLLDEGNNPDVQEICRQYGVFHFSRRGKEEFNTKQGKYTRTKGGNHNSWYEVHGNSYDFVAQIDTDFVPKRTFLTKTLGYFRDPKVAFVGTPQVYGNAETSIIAKGAAEQLHTFYGSVLKGLSSMKMTLLIGANHVIRVRALKGVNHYSAHITEDLITGMKLHAKGWKSVYISEPLAIGEGPDTWEAYFSQQLRWAYGCMDIFFKHSPKLFRRMGFRRGIYYFFLQQHYFSGIAMAVSILLLTLYFFAGLRAADVDLYQFFAFYSFTLITCWLMSVYLQRFNIYKNKSAEFFLAGKIISIAAWPVWFLAFVSILIGKRLNYKVTPKGEDGKRQRASLKTFLPHIIFGGISLVDFISSYFTGRQNLGMMFWAASSAFLMLSVPFFQDIADLYNVMSRRVRLLVRKLYITSRRVDTAISVEFFPKQVNSSDAKKHWQDVLSYNGYFADVVFLVAIVLISSALYINRIGFYSDDWAFLGNFSLSKDQSLLGLFFTTTTPNTFMRPVQNFYEAVLFWMFGIKPLGYQIVNTAIYMGISAMFYMVLRQLKIPRIIALTIPLVYILLPNYSTDRFWFAAHQANLSILLYFISLFSEIKALQKETARKTMWRVISISTLVLSLLSYEVVLPLYLINLFILLNPFNAVQRLIKRTEFSGSIVFLIIISIALFYSLLFKVITTSRLNDTLDTHYLLQILPSAFAVNYGTWVMRLPQIWSQIILQYSDTTTIVYGFGIYLVIFLYLHHVITRSSSFYPSSSLLRNLTLAGFAIFTLAYMIFFTNKQVGFSPVGLENRVAIAASIGVAFTLVGMLGWFSKVLFPEKISKFFYCVCIAILCTGSILTINSIANFWEKAHEKGQLVLRDIQGNIPLMPKDSTLLLDGVCPYVGPAPVFEADWDLKGALQTYYLDPSLKADIVTPRMKVKDNGITTTIYTFTTKYPYRNLYIYNYNQKRVHSIENMEEARSYFAEYNSDFDSDCPNAMAGEGVKIF